MLRRTARVNTGAIADILRRRARVVVLRPAITARSVMDGKGRKGPLHQIAVRARHLYTFAHTVATSIGVVAIEHDITSALARVVADVATPRRIPDATFRKSNARVDRTGHPATARRSRAEPWWRGQAGGRAARAARAATGCDGGLRRRAAMRAVSKRRTATWQARHYRRPDTARRIDLFPANNGACKTPRAKCVGDVHVAVGGCCRCC